MSAPESSSAAPIVLIGGASGAGKSRLSYRLAHYLGAALVEVDDLVVAAQAITDPTTSPALHYWRTHDSAAMSSSETLDGQIRFAHALEPALSAVIDNHIETATPVVIEGDYIVPRPSHDRSVRAVVVHEDDLDQLVANYRTREPELGEQRARAVVSLAYGRWLTAQAHAVAVPVVAARPWATAFDRLLTALDLV